MSKQVLVAPSTHPCPLGDLLEYAKSLLANGADWLHCDIMDGKFVADKTFDELALALVARRVNLPMDVHLMVVDPMDKIPAFATAGATSITVHYEAFGSTLEIMQAINLIHDSGCKAGIAIKPATPVVSIANLLPFVDIVMVMSVEPGKSGQPFLPNSNSKIAELHAIRHRNRYEYLIEVDGGINRKNVGTVVSLGADVVVLGSAMYTADDRRDLIDFIKCVTD
mgnify:FL=1